MKILWRLTKMLLVPKRWIIIVVILTTLIISAVPYGFSFFGKWLVDEALQVSGVPTHQAKSEAEKLHLLLVFFLVSIGVHVVSTGMGGGTELLKSKAIHEMIFTLRSRVHEKLENADLGQFLTEQPGQHMTRLLDDTGNIPGNVVNLWVNIITQLGMLVLGLVLLLKLNPLLAIVTLAALPFFAVTSALLLPKLKNVVTDIRTYWSTLIGHVVERLSSIETVKNYVQEAREVAEFSNLVERSLNLNRKNNRLNLLLGSISGLITAFATLAVLVIGILNIRSGNMQLGAVLAFYAVTAQLFVPIGTLVGMFVILQTVSIYGERVFSVLDSPVHIRDMETPVVPDRIAGNIEFRNASLQYQEGGPFAISDLSFAIPTGTSAAIVGPTGCGKSTVISLLTRLYEVTQGEIFIDEINIKSLPVQLLRQSVGNILYDTPVFSGTIAENISLASPSVKQPAIEEAAKRSGLHEYIIELDSGYATRLGGGGIQLETVELIKLGIARLLATDPPIITVDDTFAGVNEETEQYLQSALRKAISGKTFLMATSRITAAKTCNLIIVLQKGRLVQIGTHDELLAIPGLYRRMYMRQVGLPDN